MDFERKWHNIKDPAIGELQKILNLEETCRASEELYIILKDIVFEFDEKNALILWVQKRLRAMGYYKNFPNGLWRQNTVNSIYKLQACYSLERNGLNNEVWYHLLRG